MSLLLIGVGVELTEALRLFVGAILFVLGGLALYGLLLLGGWLYARLSGRLK